MVVVLKDYWAVWCGPCRAMNPVIEELEKKYGKKIKIEKINVDEEPDKASEQGIMSIPTYILEKDGEAVRQWIGITPKEVLEEAIDEALD